MNWIDTNITEPPKDKKILACIVFCGTSRINVIHWSKYSKTWITDMQLNHINPPLFWMELPKMP